MDAIKNKQKYGAKQSRNQLFFHDPDFDSYGGGFFAHGHENFRTGSAGNDHCRIDTDNLADRTAGD
jgi:hypothetical protein